HRLQYVLNMHSSDITGMLRKLCTDDYLESDNNGRWTIYKLKQKVDTSDRKVDTSDKNTENQSDINKKVDTSDRKVDTSDRKVDTSKVATRLSKNDLEKLIMQTCSQEYIKMEEVARI